eukprot:3121551-Amphidinium_carterae.2
MGMANLHPHPLETMTFPEGETREENLIKPRRLKERDLEEEEIQASLMTMMTHPEMMMMMILLLKIKNRELQFVVEYAFNHFNQELLSPSVDFAGRSIVITTVCEYFICSATAVSAPKEEVISKYSSKVLAKLEVKNHHHMNAIVLKRTWDIWLTQVQQTFNMWSTPAAHHFKNTLEQSQERYKAWEELPIEKKLAFEQKYVFGLRSLPPI